jgi:hypothetical protein
LENSVWKKLWTCRETDKYLTWQPLIQRIPEALSPRVKWPKRQANHPHRHRHNFTFHVYFVLNTLNLCYSLRTVVLKPLITHRLPRFSSSTHGPHTPLNTTVQEAIDLSGDRQILEIEFHKVLMKYKKTYVLRIVTFEDLILAHQGKQTKLSLSQGISIENRCS